ncbi:MAG: GNAT family N-acetyltransferase, partial [Verrucomicrobia bacterium]|nr:GNAT family N-acetyltransferase [Verrucomicrobiota bacterium]
LLHETYRVAERYVELSNSIKQLVLNAYDSLSERIVADFPLTLVDLFEEPTQVEQKYLTDHAVSPTHEVLIQTIANRWSRDVLRLRKSQIRSYDSDLPWRLVLDLAHSQLAKNLLGPNKTDDESTPSENEQWIKDLIAQSCRTYGNLAQKRVWSALSEALDLPVGESNLYVPILGDPTQFYYEKVRSLLGGEDSSLHRKKDLDFELLEFAETTFESAAQKACFKMLTEMSIYTDEKSEAKRLINLLLCGDSRKDASQHWQLLLLPHYPNEDSLRDQCGFNWLSVENGGRCKLEASFIRPAWTGFGIGKKLLLATIDAAKKLGAKQIYKPASECGPDLASLLSLLDFTIELDPTSKSTQFRLELSS